MCRPIHIHHISDSYGTKRAKVFQSFSIIFVYAKSYVEWCYAQLFMQRYEFGDIKLVLKIIQKKGLQGSIGDGMSTKYGPPSFFA